MESDNKYKEGRIDGQIDTKKENNYFTELITEIEKVIAFETYLESRRMLNSLIFLPIIINLF